MQRPGAFGPRGRRLELVTVRCCRQGSRPRIGLPAGTAPSAGRSPAAGPAAAGSPPATAALRLQRDADVRVQGDKPFVETGEPAPVMPSQGGEVGVGHLPVAHDTVPSHGVVRQHVGPEVVPGMRRHDAEQGQRGWGRGWGQVIYFTMRNTGPDPIRIRTAARHGAQAADPCAQSCSGSPVIRSNSRRLCVTSVAPSASAWQAIQRSLAPMGVPASRSRVKCSA